MNLEELIPERYRIFFNRETNSFRILDTWHPTIKNLNIEANPDIPDNSPALKTLSAEEVNALIGELIKLGWLDKIIDAKVAKNQMPHISSPAISKPATKDLIVEKIAAITLDDSGKAEPHTSMAKEAIIALREIAAKL